MDAGPPRQFVDPHAVLELLRQCEQTPIGGRHDLGLWVGDAGSGIGQSVIAEAERAHGLLQRLLERGADCHHFADALHLAADPTGGGAKLVQIPAGHLDGDVVERRLEETAGDAGHGVFELRQAVTEGQLGRDPGERVAGRLAREGAGTREPGVDFDDARLAAVRVEGELDVALADDPEGVDDAKSAGAEAMVLLVIERLRGSDDDALAGMDPHRVEILEVADGDGIAVAVPHHLVLELSPSLEVLLDE